ncbi:MAG: Zn-ribbon domain-containing OB-fold protein [Myxococcota bacterium]
MSEEQEPVTRIVTPVRSEYVYRPGVAAARYLSAMAQGKILGQACDSCGRVYVPARGACPRCGVPTTQEVELADKGTVVTLTVVRVPSENIKVDLPYCVANILLDGADISFTGLIQECPLEDVRIGMRVQAVWKDASEWGPTSENIRHWKPIDEPDVPFDELEGVS